MVKNDNHLPLAGASLVIEKIALSTGVATAVYTEPALTLPAGPGASSFFTIDAGIDGHDYVLRARVTDVASAETLTDNLIPLLPPANWTTLPRDATDTFAVAPAANADGSVDIALSTDKTAAYVTLTTLAQGRFTDNAFLLLPSEPTTVRYMPFWGSSASDYQTLVATLRLEHVATYL